MSRPKLFIIVSIFLAAFAFADSTVVISSTLSYPCRNCYVYYSGHAMVNESLGAYMRVNGAATFRSAWIYKVQDTIYTDSAALILKKIDTVGNSVTCTFLDGVFPPAYLSSRASLLYFGRYNAPTWTVRLDSVKSTGALLTLFTFPSQRHYVFSNDTIAMHLDTLTKFHIYEESLPLVNCRDIVNKAPIVSPDRYGYSFWFECQGSNYADILCRLYGPSIGLSISYGQNSEVLETLYIQEHCDSIKKEISLGETWALPLTDTAITLQWTFLQGYFPDAGITLAPKNVAILPRSSYLARSNIGFSGCSYDILGRKIAAVSIKGNIVLKRKLINGNLIIGKGKR